MRPIRTRVAGLLTTLALVAAAPAATVEAAPAVAPQAVAAKPCSSGYTHAVLPTGHKCLRRGQFCVRRWDRRYYHRYGYHCHRYDPSVDRYRLT